MARGARSGQRKIVDGRYATEGVRDRRTYDVSPDGRRFLMIKQATDEVTAPQIVVVHNWLEELKRLVPPNEQATRL